MAIGPNVVDDCEGMTEEDYWRGMDEAILDLDTTAKSSNMANFDPAFDKMIRNEGGFKTTHIEKE